MPQGQLGMHATSSWSCLTSELSVQLEWVVETVAIVGAATSITLSAMSASLSRSMDESAEARIILTLAGEPLEEQFTEERIGISRCTELITKELLHVSE